MEVLTFIAIIAFASGCQFSRTDTAANRPATAANTSASPGAVAVEPSGGFGTDLAANYKLNQFKKISEVAEYVRSHEDLFFK